MRIVGNAPSGGKKPTTPTIGTATDGGTGTTVSVAFTPSTYIGKGTITYTATSNPGSLTGTGSGSPITVSGLTTGTAYTFTVNGTTNYGVASDSSAASNSVTPASPSSFESIATATRTGGSGSVTFTSIPATYKHLQLRVIARDAGTGATNPLSITINGAGSPDFAYHRLQGNGSTASANGTASTFQIATTPISSTSYSGVWGVSIIDIIDYASTSKNKTLRTFTGFDANGTGVVGISSGVYLSTTAITSIVISSNNGMEINSSVALYGIKGS